MLGWWIAIRKPSSDSAIAHWEANLGGLDWLNKLVEEKRATCQRKGDYPSLYTAKAKDILPILQEGPPHVMKHINWIELEDNAEAEDKEKVIECGGKKWIDGGKIPRIKISQDEMATCDQDELLTVEVWDLS